MSLPYLFVYGTLLQAGNQFAAYLAKHSSFVATGKVKGKLYDIGEYPGLILDEAHTDVVGSVYQVHNHQVLETIDAYEGVGPTEEQPNLYRRVLAKVETAAGCVDAWIYEYNLPVDGLQKITSGDYIKYRTQKNPPVVKLGGS